MNAGLVTIWSRFAPLFLYLYLLITLKVKREILLTLDHVEFCLNIQLHTSVPKAQPATMHRNSSIAAC